MQGAGRTPLGYSSLDSDSEDEDTHVLGTFNVFVGFVMCRDTIFDLMLAQVTAATATFPFQGITAVALSYFSLVLRWIRSRHAAQSRKKCCRYAECWFLRTCQVVLKSDGVCMLACAGGRPARGLPLTVIERQSRDSVRY